MRCSVELVGTAATVSTVLSDSSAGSVSTMARSGNKVDGDEVCGESTAASGRDGGAAPPVIVLERLLIRGLLLRLVPLAMLDVLFTDRRDGGFGEGASASLLSSSGELDDMIQISVHLQIAGLKRTLQHLHKQHSMLILKSNPLESCSCRIYTQSRLLITTIIWRSRPVLYETGITLHYKLLKLETVQTRPC